MERRGKYFLLGSAVSICMDSCACAGGSLCLQCWSRVLLRRPRRNHRDDRGRRQEYPCLYLHLLRDIFPIFGPRSASLRRILRGTVQKFSARTLIEGNPSQGRYLPVFASEIYDQNQVALRQGRPTINLQSVLIGNGITDISTCVFSLTKIGARLLTHSSHAAQLV